MSKPTSYRSAENGKKIIEDNIQVLYHLPKKYKFLNSLIRDDVRKTLFGILNFVKDKDPIIYKQKYVYFLDNTTLTQKIRKKTTASVSSRHFNFLCCIGVLNKIKQTADDKIGINWEFLMENPDKKIGINVFSVYRYTEKELERLESRAKQLCDGGITSGNLSYNQLMAAGLQELALEVYFLNDERSFTKKEYENNLLFSCIDRLIQEHGYTTKNMVYGNMNLSVGEVDKLFKIYKKKFMERYTYSPPKKCDREKYDIQSYKWIIKTKE